MKYKIMADIVEDVAKNLSVIRSKMAKAISLRTADVEKDSKKTELVAVSKTKSLVAIKRAYDAGQRHFGENYVKELTMKANNPDMAELCPDIKWHYIGTFQKKMAASLTRLPNLFMIQTLNSCVGADALNSRWHGTEPLRVLFQVNTSREESKSGAAPDDCVKIATHIRQNCPNLSFSGLMTIGAIGHDYTDSPNPDFTCLRECKTVVSNALNTPEYELELSMGMSADFTHAIEAGSTSIRVGSSIFGARDYPI